MIDYWAIVKQAFNLTLRYPALWLLGLFLAGGFNANFFYLANLKLGWRDLGLALLLRLGEGAPVNQLFFGTLVTIIGGAILIVITNWAKIVFVLRVSDILQLQRMRPQQAMEQEPNIKYTIFEEAPRFLPATVAMSVFTVISMLIITAILAGGPQWLFASRGIVWFLAALIFMALIFFFSCLNIFGTFFIIFYRRRFASAVNLAIDLIVKRWRNIIEMAVILMVIYGLGFFVGTALLSVLVIPVLGGIVLWLWLAIVNTFFNICLLLLFAQLVKPPYHPEFKSLLADLTAPAPSPASTASLMDRSAKL